MQRLENILFRRKPAPAYTASSSAEDAVKKFGNAKSISSDMYFGNKDDVS